MNTRRAYPGDLTDAQREQIALLFPQQGRWVAERTFAWSGRYRPLSKDYEQATFS